MATRRNCTFRTAGVLSGNYCVSYFGFGLDLYSLANRMRRLVELGLKAKPRGLICETANGGLQISGMKRSKIKEHVCPACNGTGYPVVMQPVQPGRKIYPVKCKVCDGKGRLLT